MQLKNGEEHDFHSLQSVLIKIHPSLLTENSSQIYNFGITTIFNLYYHKK